ncbi:hypothetical protein A7U60_g2480 [Sanghuangporus baumii]|uniref:Protein kinase domain-containing protein n=1 Tax=Sanghuangporus baumii TaxID=108892 RepID=A0A9Q5I2E8_SANBA|nr:hypothetical protein A7U60_g2480 [Sanghuangporus baumii]
MTEVFPDAVDEFHYLKNEVNSKRALGLLGEIDPEIVDGIKDKNAEKIQELLLNIGVLLSRMNDEGNVSYPWYSLTGIFEKLCAYPFGGFLKHDLKTRLTILVEEAKDLTLTTTQFREHYMDVYKAALYSILPKRPASHEFCIWNNSINHPNIASVPDVGLRIEQSLHGPYSYIFMDLDTAHLFDRRLASLSVDMAKLLEMFWKQRKTISNETGNLICRSGSVFQYLLQKSQGNVLIRSEISRHLDDASRIIDILGRLARLESSDDARSASIENANEEQIQREIQATQVQAGEKVEGFMSQLNFFVSRDVTVQESVQDSTPDEFVDLPENLTYEAIVEKMTELSDHLAFSGSPGSQHNLSGDAPRGGSYSKVYKVKLREELRFFVSRDVTVQESVQDSTPDEFVNLPENLTYEAIVEKMTELSDHLAFSGSPGSQHNLSGDAPRGGSYSKVYKVKLREELRVDVEHPGKSNVRLRWDIDEVAVKVLKISAPEEEEDISRRAFREFIVWSQMRHPNIIPLVGLWFDFTPDAKLPAFVSPWITNGSLSVYLQKKGRIKRKRRLRLLLDVAKALAYMHNNHPQVCHGDINPDNILVLDGRAFVCDFGISQMSPLYDGLFTKPHGDWKYRAPEQLPGESVPAPTPRSDMYSFGLLCYNVLTGLEPWKGISQGQRINKRGLIMRRPKSMPVNEYTFLKYCWKLDPRLRATANIAIAKLEELIALENAVQ